VCDWADMQLLGAAGSYGGSSSVVAHSADAVCWVSKCFCLALDCLAHPDPWSRKAQWEPHPTWFTHPARGRIQSLLATVEPWPSREALA
jgi:hypothetical protein